MISFTQTEQLYTPNQVSAASVACGTTNVPVYGFAFNSTGFANPVFTGLAGFVTGGTYVSGDIVNFKLYQTNFSVFNTSNLLSTITTGLGPGPHTFPAFSYTVSPSPVARYFWITMDIQPTAAGGNTVIVSPLTIAMTTITGTETAATITVGGTQTITCGLPVELLSFSGTALVGKNRIEWITLSESNNDYFTVERSTDGMNFLELTKVNGSGNAQEEISYSVTDDRPEMLTYYRLRQTDFNNLSTFHQTIAVHNNEAAVVFSPNPACNKVIVESTGGIYCITDMNGMILRSYYFEKGTCEFDISDLSDGIYFFCVNGVDMQKISICH